MSRPALMTIDLTALRHNFQCVQTLAPGCSIIAMVKANAYGHGLVRVARALSQADALGVASLEEGVILREAGITKPIILMEGLFATDEIREASKQGFSLVVPSLAHVSMLEQCKGGQNFPIWIKINTGMNRLGIDPDDTQKVYQRLSAMSAVKQPIGFMSHFAQADHPESPFTLKQASVFNTVTRGLTNPRSLANSAAILAFPETHADWVRPGLMLYGASPFPEKTGFDHQLQPVMTLASRIIAKTFVKKGEKVGYGGTFTAPHDLPIGVVGVGYGDGYPQYAHNGTPVLVNNQICLLAGRVSMDMLTVDLSQQPNAQVGDPVILWGPGLPVERIALQNNTSAYEILTRMTPRPKIEIKEEATLGKQTLKPITTDLS